MRLVLKHLGMDLATFVTPVSVFIYAGETMQYPIPDNMRIKCVVCEIDLHIEDKDTYKTTGAPIFGGVWFEATGNFGSVVWDMNGTAFGGLCDTCFIKKAHTMLGVAPGTIQVVTLSSMILSEN